MYFLRVKEEIFDRPLRAITKCNLADDLRLIALFDVLQAVDNSLKNSSFTIQHLNKASALIHAHGAAWRKHDLAR